jgi:hypothetical protein
MGIGDGKEKEVSGVMDQKEQEDGESSSVGEDPPSPSHGLHDGGHKGNAAKEHKNDDDDDDDRGHENSSLQDKSGNAEEEEEEEDERISSQRLYGYEDADQSMHSARNQQRMTRRNVVTAEVARYEMSYHPGRLVSITFHPIFVSISCDDGADTPV